MSTGTADLFDLDDLLSDVAVTGIDKEEKEEKEEAAPEPPKINRLRARCPDNVLFFDLETIPDYAREPLFDLPALPEIIQPAPETASADMMPAAEWVTQDVAAAKQTVSNRNPSMAWIDAARAAEIAKVKGGSRNQSAAKDAIPRCKPAFLVSIRLCCGGEVGEWGDGCCFYLRICNGSICRCADFLA
jgi:hypothetical protein